MAMPIDEAEAGRLRAALAESLAREGVLPDPGWRAAVEKVPRHTFVPGFYLPAEQRDADGLTVWEPVTAELDRDRWLHAAYSDTTLVTQFDGDEADWKEPASRYGGSPTSSSTLPSLVMRMWADADLRDGHRILEIGTGTGYSTALACERLGSEAVTSIDVDGRRLDQAAAALYGCGYNPPLAVADGLYGYWPEAPVDRIVAACSFRTVPPALIAQTRPGGKILITLSGWLYGYARVLLTVIDRHTARGSLLPGTISFMAARTHAAPAFGNPAHWVADLPERPRVARHHPDRITSPTEQAFHLRFLAQSAVPYAQLTVVGDVLHLVDVVSGSAATLTPAGDDWQVREVGRVKLWERIERILDAYDGAGEPTPETFSLQVTRGEQRLRHPLMPGLTLSPGDLFEQSFPGVG
ncbi:ATP-grasp peptide maturase system methyltransferase [Actinoallomurus rhizosphaericola]|uniref:ATP-grasp peptide maturase system methyltransferase n=1 Tax=Actinoallomurus rhizosphaericola TaxID=2952536 RepID=UPI002091F552|nr:ATP-grasp peptide maturase system methyltransferase [Actinoallomurus rhizosphaericola]MCO5996339.1 ATP-grasp peptide maturase system methyltransferase [Actinoallomurus rhizosphaericola]